MPDHKTRIGPDPASIKVADQPANYDLMLELAKQHLGQEMPNQLNDASFTPYFGDKHTFAQTDPFSNNIAVNTRLVPEMNQDQFEDVLAHELTHVRQNQDDAAGSTMYRMMKHMPKDVQNMYLMYRQLWGPGYSFYSQNPAELDAFQTMKDRALKQGRLSFPTPAFKGGESRDSDIYLPPSHNSN